MSSDSALTIRSAETADLPAVLDLLDRWAKEGITRGLCPDGRSELQARLSDIFLVATRADEIVGFAIGQIRSTANNEFVEGVLDDQPQYLELQDLYVVPFCRGRGVGTALAETLLARAAESGVANSLVYSANRDYVRTARFYEKLGYQMWHIHMTRRG